jgi:hypothetical protein
MPRVHVMHKDVRMPWAHGCAGAADALERRTRWNGSFRTEANVHLAAPRSLSAVRRSLLVHLRLTVVLKAYALNQIELRFQPVNMFFF